MGRFHRLIRFTSSAAVLITLAGLAACGENAPSGSEDETGTERPTGPTGTGGEAAPSTPRIDPATPGTLPSSPANGNPGAPAVSDLELAAAAASANQFAFDLFRRAVPPGENAVMSPLNVRHALALAWAGAGGRTREAMSAAIHLSADPGAEDQQHAALAGLVAHALSPIGSQPAPEPGEPDTRPQVSFASRVWVQDGYALAERIRQHADFANLILLAVSGYGHAEAMQVERPAALVRLVDASRRRVAVQHPDCVARHDQPVSLATLLR